jgi:hypothetical protein
MKTLRGLEQISADWVIGTKLRMSRSDMNESGGPENGVLRQRISLREQFIQVCCNGG